MIRDLELRWGDGSAVPDWFLRKNIPEWIFVKHLRKLKISASPNITKINIYCGDVDRQYSGEVFDGVADVNVVASWKEVECWSTQDFVEYVLKLMVAGLNKMASVVDFESCQLDCLADKVLSEIWSYSEPIGKKSEKFPSGHSARLYVRPDPCLRWCSVFLQIKSARKIVLDIEVCTTFPDPQRSTRDFVGLYWVSDTIIELLFDTAGARGKRIYGRLNYDCFGLSNVERLDANVPEMPFFSTQPKFRVYLGGLLLKGRDMAEGI